MFIAVLCNIDGRVGGGEVEAVARAGQRAEIELCARLGNVFGEGLDLGSVGGRVEERNLDARGLQLAEFNLAVDVQRRILAEDRFLGGDVHERHVGQDRGNGTVDLERVVIPLADLVGVGRRLRPCQGGMGSVDTALDLDALDPDGGVVNLDATAGAAKAVHTPDATRENAVFDHEGLVLGDDAEVGFRYEGMCLVTGSQTAGNDGVVERATFNRHVRRPDRGLCTLVGIAVVDNGSAAAHNGTVECAVLNRDVGGADLRLGIGVDNATVRAPVLHQVAAKHEKLRSVANFSLSTEGTAVDGHVCNCALVVADELLIVRTGRTADNGFRDGAAVDHDMRVLHCGMVDLILFAGIVAADHQLPFAALNGHRVVERSLLSGVAPLVPATNNAITNVGGDMRLCDGNVLACTFNINRVRCMNPGRERQSARNGNGHRSLPARLMGLRHLVDNRHGAARPVKDNLECRIHFAIPLVMFDNRAVAQCAAKFPRFHVSRTGGETLPPPENLSC